MHPSHPSHPLLAPPTAVLSHTPPLPSTLLPLFCWPSCSAMQLVSSDMVAPFGIDSIRVDSNFMFVGMSREEEGIVKVYNLAAGGASHQLTGHKVNVACSLTGKTASWLLLHAHLPRMPAAQRCGQMLGLTTTIWLRPPGQHVSMSHASPQRQRMAAFLMTLNPCVTSWQHCASPQHAGRVGHRVFLRLAPLTANGAALWDVLHNRAKCTPWPLATTRCSRQARTQPSVCGTSTSKRVSLCLRCGTVPHLMIKAVVKASIRHANRKPAVEGSCCCPP